MIATITVADVVRECVVFGVCLLAAIAMNAYSIVHYQTEWSELYTELGFVATLAVILYAARCVAKALIITIRRLVKKLRNRMKR